jgi:hypothetical protein
MTPTGPWRFSILRIYWDGSGAALGRMPVGDFFGLPWGRYSPLVSRPFA